MGLMGIGVLPYWVLGRRAESIFRGRVTGSGVESEACWTPGECLPDLKQWLAVSHNALAQAGPYPRLDVEWEISDVSGGTAAGLVKRLRRPPWESALEASGRDQGRLSQTFCHRICSRRHGMDEQHWRRPQSYHNTTRLESHL
jgi:hypothetical protein